MLGRTCNVPETSSRAGRRRLCKRGEVEPPLPERQARYARELGKSSAQAASGRILTHDRRVHETELPAICAQDVDGTPRARGFDDVSHALRALDGGDTALGACIFDACDNLAHMKLVDGAHESLVVLTMPCGGELEHALVVALALAGYIDASFGA